LLLARAAQTVQDLAARHGIDAGACEVRAGKAEDVIAAIERRDDADLLVMGAVSRSVETHPVIGNTAERVIDRVACDLLVIKPATSMVRRVSTNQRRPPAGRHLMNGRSRRAPAQYSYAN
jgi:hypothetical protein